MKDERMAILSMVEKGVISVDEAERLLSAMRKNGHGEDFEKAVSKAGDSLSAFAKTVSEKTEKLINDAKPAVKNAGEKVNKALDDVKPVVNKTVDDVKPVVKKAAETFAEKADEIKEKLKEKRGFDDETKKDDETEDKDFEKDVTIIPFEKPEDENDENKDE